MTGLVAVLVAPAVLLQSNCEGYLLRLVRLGQPRPHAAGFLASGGAELGHFCYYIIWFPESVADLSAPSPDLDAASVVRSDSYEQ